MGVFTPMEQFLNNLKNKNYQNRKIALIENGTWAPSATKSMLDIISQMKNITIIEPKITIKSRMNENTLTDLEKLADEIIK